MLIEYIDFTSCGLVRQLNQDSVFAVSQNEYGLFAVADGMGGHFGGEIASSRLVNMLKIWWSGFISEIYEFDKCYNDLRQIMYDANESIFNEFSDIGKICGTTVGLLFIFRDKYILINSGDTRIYAKHGFKAIQLSKDHIYGKEAVISGNMTKEEVNISPNKNKLTAAIGSKRELKMYIASAPINSLCFFICSDGVYKFCNYFNIVLAMQIKDPQQYITKIIEKNGAGDNYSFIKIKIKEMTENGGKC